MKIKRVGNTDVSKHLVEGEQNVQDSRNTEFREFHAQMSLRRIEVDEH